MKHKSVWELLTSGKKISREEEEITLKMYKDFLTKRVIKVKDIVEESKSASLTERGMISYVLTVCDFADVAHKTRTICGEIVNQ